MKRRPHGVKILSLLKSAGKNWSNDNALSQSAAISYYTTFSIAPLLILSIAIAGLVFGAEASQGKVFDEIRGLLGPNGAEAIEAMIKSASQQSSSGILATIIGTVTSLVGASGVFQ